MIPYTILRRLQIVSRQLTTMAAAQKTTVTLNNGEAPRNPLDTAHTHRTDALCLERFPAPHCKLPDPLIWMDVSPAHPANQHPVALCVWLCVHW